MGLSFPIEDKLKWITNLRVQILVLTLVGWGIGMAIDRTEVNKYRMRADDIFTAAGNMGMVRTDGHKAALIILSIIETLLFGLGVGFFIAVGFRVFKIQNKMLRKRMIWCWACISFFMCSWWPHSTSHSLIFLSSADPIDNYIAMELSFHWTIMFCSLTLAYFQYDLISLMYEVAMMRLKMKENREVDPLKKQWYHNFKIHALVIIAIMWGVCMAIFFHFDPLDKTMKTYQIFFYVTFKIVDSVVCAIGFGFAYVAVRTIVPLPSNAGKKVSIISSCCITFLFLIQYPHPMVHTKLPATMTNVVAVDYGIHIPIIIATAVLAFYQFRMLELATDAKSSLSVAAQMRRKTSTAASNTNGISMDRQGETGNTGYSGSFGTSSVEESLSKDPSVNIEEVKAPKSVQVEIEIDIDKDAH
ncbi:hypothetical protein CYY_002674 [Polysphondylium violaceum]|uniref:Uncharacterized protein n=1 Tax=Polysphondylium violaceum TaxID=133409 RepID=A0A8J4Q198_9MYCE|nr:hypothetical protein CYY_002674 [Polysphondylium violaceum]